MKNVLMRSGFEGAFQHMSYTRTLATMLCLKKTFKNRLVDPCYFVYRGGPKSGDAFIFSC